MHSLTRTHANTHAYTYQSNSTPLHFAANHGHASALDVLIAAKANLEAVDHVIHTLSLSFFLSLSLSLTHTHTHTRALARAHTHT